MKLFEVAPEIVMENEVHKIEEPQDIINAITDIVNNKSAATLKLRDGKILMDIFTASALQKVFGALSPQVRDKTLAFIIEHGKRGLITVVNKAFAVLK